jgi:hypothetical protein
LGSSDEPRCRQEIDDVDEGESRDRESRIDERNGERYRVEQRAAQPRDRQTTTISR